MRKVLLDQGSSTDIIYGATFDKMGLTDNDLIPYTGNVVGFAGERVHVRGYIKINTIFGKGDYAVATKVKYLVLACSASYNVIVGRHTLNDICCVI